ncbi:MAG: site-specific integrase [Actinomycetota bacterium]|nr:site-specific integrase [Actinomycetota bacterium]
MPPPTLGRFSGESTWTALELKHFLSSVREDPLYPLWFVLAMTGIRRGEALGLRWSDVDLDRCQLMIRQTVVAAGNQIHLSTPKTTRGRRVVALDRPTVVVLRAHQVSRAALTRGELLFHDGSGHPLHPVGVSKRFTAVVERAGLPRIRLHDLRHTHATVALEAGIHPKIVSERLGHATVALTLDIYSHALQHMQRDAADQIAAIVFPES